MNSVTPQTIPLGKTAIQISPMGAGAWQWGDRSWDYGKGGYTDEDIRQAFHTTLDSGINWIDTAEVYGFGKSEKILGQLLKESGKNVVVATKFFPFPFRLFGGQFEGALKKSLGRLGLSSVDLYQVHWPIPPHANGLWLKQMSRAFHQGLIRAVGVSNYSLEQTQNAAALLNDQGAPLASNQLHYSLLNRKIEKSGLLDYCKQNQVTVIAYSPLEKGILTGKYTAQNIPSGMARRQYTPEYIQRAQPLIGLLREIGQAHGGKNPGQVALNWLLCKGAVPIPGAKNLRQAQENAGALGWMLTSAEVEALDRMSDLLTTGN